MGVRKKVKDSSFHIDDIIDYEEDDDVISLADIFDKSPFGDSYYNMP